MLNDSTKEIGPEETAELESPIQAEPDIEREGFSLERSLRNPRTWISFGLALAIILFAFRGLDINVAEVWEYIRNANPWWLLSGFFLFYCTFPLRAIRWRMLLVNANVPVQEGRKTWASMPALMEYIYLSWFAIY
jgi:uncharacterized membrane protein YbhN (UPF0104 family)